jgi:hypothetical protein
MYTEFFHQLLLLQLFSASVVVSWGRTERKGGDSDQRWIGKKKVRLFLLTLVPVRKKWKKLTTWNHFDRTLKHDKGLDWLDWN